MQIITLFEHRTLEYSKLPWLIGHPLLDQLEQINTINKTELIQIGRHALRARQYVGIIRSGDVTLQLLPKIDANGNSDDAVESARYEDAVRSATQNLFYMLAYATDIDVRAQDTSLLHSHPNDWFELLTRFFATELHKQMKIGLEHTYVHVEENTATLRGTWQIERHITRLPHMRHRFDVRYDDFLADTVLNRIFAYAVKILLPTTRNSYNKRLLSDIDMWLIEIPRSTFITRNDLDAVRFSRLNERFRTAFNLARMFLEKLSPALVDGQTQSFSFVFDMNELFEQFVAKFIRRYRRGIFPEEFSDAQVVEQAEAQTYYLAERLSNQKSVFKLIPDILFFRPNSRFDVSPLAIIDTKYKRLDPDNAKSGVSEADFYQMLAYTTRLNCRHVMLLYPQSATNGEIMAEFVIPTKPDHRFYASTIDLRQPLDKPDQLIADLQRIFATFFLGVQ